MIPPPPRSSLFPYTTLFRSLLNQTPTVKSYLIAWSGARVSERAVALALLGKAPIMGHLPLRSEEHTSELQSQSNLVCRLLLEKKKKNRVDIIRMSYTL